MPRLANPRDADKKQYLPFRGYIDESYDGAAQTLFSLSCLIATEGEWFEMERAWEVHLEGLNKKLTEQERPTISRYHAADCSGRRNQFEGWTRDERDHFVLGLFGIFKRIPVHAVGAFFLRKPFRRDEFLQRVREALDEPL